MTGDMLPPAGKLVTVPVVGDLSMMQPGKVVAAPVAPPAGPTGDHDNVVVQVKEWFQSSTIWVSIVALVGLGMDAIIEGLLTTEGPIQWKALLTRALLAIGFGYQAMRRKSDNSVIR